MDLGQAIKKGFYLFFLSLPIIIINIVLFLAAGLGNLGLFFLSVGHIAVVPIAVAITHIFTGLLPLLTGGLVGRSTVFKPASDIGQLVPAEVFKSVEFNVTPSYWSAHIVFFFSYLFFNALDVYTLPSVEQSAADEWRVSNRKDRATMIMILSVVLTFLLLLSRYFLTDLDTLFGMFLVAFPLMGALGYGWYRAASAAGVRTMDVFGIVQQMVPITEETNLTYCVPPSKA